MRSRPFLLAALALACLCYGCRLSFPDAAPVLVRQKMLADAGWRFAFGAPDDLDEAAPGLVKAGQAGGRAAADFDDSAWSLLDLPHDWAVDLPFDASADLKHGYKPVGAAFPQTSIGWYRYHFRMPGSDDGRRVGVEFEGVFRDSIVWLNGHRLGRHDSGYTDFAYDLSDVLDYGRDNVLAVRVDARQPEGWFYEGAGIYRHVWLITTPAVHLTAEGTAITEQVDGTHAAVTVDTEVTNAGATQARCTIEQSILDDAGHKVAAAGPAEVSVTAAGTASSVLALAVDSAHLWSPEMPYRYRLVTTLRLGGALADRVETRFGLRTLRFDAQRGLLLNGAPYVVHGVCHHQDHAGVGTAVPDSLWDFRLARLKAMGCNALRTAHGPPAPALLEACDRLGMLVLDENRLMGSGPDTLSQLESLVRRDRNHPCVLAWCLGDEEHIIQNEAVGARMAATMMTCIRSLDDSRAITYAADNGEHFEGINRAVDVRGFNYGLAAADAYHRAHPLQPCIGTEQGSTMATRGCYLTDATHAWLSNYEQTVPDWGAPPQKWWPFYEARPWLSGAFLWSGFDYRGEPTPYQWPAVGSQFGVMDQCGFAKDDYFYYQACWTAAPMVHLLGHWNWSGPPGHAVDVRCYSNCEEVDVTLNGVSLGRRRLTEHRAQWTVPYAAGVLAATGFKAGQPAATDQLATAGPPQRVELSAARSMLAADGEDLAVVTVAVRDQAGHIVPDAGNQVDIAVTGQGRLLGVGNGDPSSHEPDHAAQRHVFHGLAQLLVTSTRQAGHIAVHAASQGLQPADLQLTTSQAVP